jgi:hypothetical protein
MTQIARKRAFCGVPGEDHSGIIAPFAIGPSLGLCIALLRLLAEYSGLKFGWYNFIFVPQLFGGCRL